MGKTSATRILFVCTGNICRSPTAQAVALDRARRSGLDLVLDSAGTSDEELGNHPDRRAKLVAERRGYRMPDHRARVLEAVDFRTFDHIIGMTRQHELILGRRALPETRAQIGLLMRFSRSEGPFDVPDPWLGDLDDFERALDLIEEGVDGVITYLQRTAV